MKTTLVILAAGIGARYGAGLKPVSYTHLDVYKRQVERWQKY